MVDVSIIFVNYKTPEMTAEAIQSVQAHTSGISYEIIVVDNSCDANEFSLLSSLLPETVRLIDSKANLGFGKANNLGAQFASGKYLFLLNTDTLLMNNAIYELHAFLSTHPDVGVCGSNLYTKELKPNHSFEKQELTNSSIRKRSSLFSLFKYNLFKKRDDFNKTNTPLEVFGCVIGAALMISAADFATLGGFDKDIFMFGEETLLCYRMQKELHKKIYNVPSSKIIHFEGTSLKAGKKYNPAPIDGTFLYFLKAFGEKEALCYLENQTRINRKKAILSTILLRKDKANHYTAASEYAKQKLAKHKCDAKQAV